MAWTKERGSVCVWVCVRVKILGMRMAQCIDRIQPQRRCFFNLFSWFLDTPRYPFAYHTAPWWNPHTCMDIPTMDTGWIQDGYRYLILAIFIITVLLITHAQNDLCACVPVCLCACVLHCCCGSVCGSKDRKNADRVNCSTTLSCFRLSCLCLYVVIV